MSDSPPKRDVKDVLIIVATSITIIINLTMVIGGLRWFVQITDNVESIVRMQDSVTKTQEKLATHLDNIDRWKHYHEIYTAQHDKNYKPPVP